MKNSEVLPGGDICETNVHVLGSLEWLQNADGSREGGWRATGMGTFVTAGRGKIEVDGNCGGPSRVVEMFGGITRVQVLDRLVETGSASSVVVVSTVTVIVTTGTLGVLTKVLGKSVNVGVRSEVFVEAESPEPGIRSDDGMDITGDPVKAGNPVRRGTDDIVAGLLKSGIDIKVLSSGKEVAGSAP